MTDEEPRTYSIPAAARRIGVDPRTLRTAAAAGDIECTRVGSRWRIPIAELERLLGEKKDAAVDA